MMTEEIMFYGGIVGAVVLTILAIVLIPLFRKQEKKMIGRINEGWYHG